MAPEDPDILGPTEEGWKLGDDSLQQCGCAYVIVSGSQHESRTNASAGQQRKRKLTVARFWKARHALASTSLQSSKRKQQIKLESDCLWLWMIRVPPDGLSIIHHHPMRNGVHSEIWEMSRLPGIRQIHILFTLSVRAYSTQLYPNQKVKLFTGWGWLIDVLVLSNGLIIFLLPSTCVKWRPLYATFSCSYLAFSPRDMVVYVAKGQAVGSRRQS